MGGRVAYLMAAASKDFKAAITWYGGSCFRQWGDGPTPFERTAQISCPIQGHFGATDQNPTLEDMAKLDAELTKHGKAHEFYVTKIPAIRSWTRIIRTGMWKNPIASRGRAAWSFCGNT